MALEQELSPVREESEEHEASLEAALGRLEGTKMNVEKEAEKEKDVERVEDPFKDEEKVTAEATLPVSGADDPDDLSVEGPEPSAVALRDT